MSNDSPIDAGSRSKVSKAIKKAKLRDERKDHNLEVVASTYEGREWIWDLLEECGIYASSFRGDNQTEFREGKRAIGLSLLVKLNNADPNLYMKMQQEAVRRQVDGV